MGYTTVQLRRGRFRVRSGEIRVARSPLSVLRGRYRSLRAADSTGWRLAKGFGSAATATGLGSAIPDLLHALSDVSASSVGTSLSAVSASTVGASLSAVGAGSLVTVVCGLAIVSALLYRSLVDVSIPLSAVESVEVDESDRELTVVTDESGLLPFGDGRERTLRPADDAALADARTVLRTRGFETGSSDD